MVEFLPTLLHISVGLFLAGFVVFLFTFHHLVAKMAAAFAGVGALLYLFVSFAPIISHDSPYHTPLTNLIWVSIMIFVLLVLKIRHFVALRSLDLEEERGIWKSFQFYNKRVRWGMAGEAKNLAQARSSHLDTSILLRTFDSLDGDRDMAQFLASIPGFYASLKVKKDGDAFERLNSRRLPSSIMQFMDHILSSDLPDQSAKHEHIKNFIRAITADPLLLQCTFRHALLSAPGCNIFECADFVNLTVEKAWDNSTDPWTRDYAQCIVAIAINRIHNHANWVLYHLSLGVGQYRGKGNSIRLRNLIHLTRHLKTSRLRDSDAFEHRRVWYNALVEARKLQVVDITPELRNEFCALWNQLVDMAQGQAPAPLMSRSNATRILALLRTVYLPFHADTHSALHLLTASVDDHSLALRMGNMYRRCSEQGHR